MRVGREARRFHRDAGDRVAFGHVRRESDGIGARLGRRRAEVVEIGIAKGVADDTVRVRHAERRIVQQHEPDIDRHASIVGQLAQHVALGEQAVGPRLDGAVARRIGLEIDRAVFGEVDFARLAVRPA